MAKKQIKSRKLKTATYFKDGGKMDVMGGLSTTLGGAAGVLGNTFAMANPLMDSGIQANLDHSNQYNPTATSNDTLMDEWSNFSNMGHITKEQAGGKSGGEMAGGIMSGMGSGAAMGAGIGSIVPGLGTVIGAGVGAAVGGVSSFIGGLFGNNKAKKKQSSMNAQIDDTNERNYMNLQNKAGAIGKLNAFNASANYAAFGGQLNASEYNNGLSFIGGGGTHESNAQGGVPMGVDLEGTPNMVEEGEVVFNDYVFSNRLAPDKNLLKDNNLDGKYKNHSFAMIAEKLSKEGEERPNDPISKAGLKDAMSKLTQAQEQLKAKQQEEEMIAQGIDPSLIEQMANGGLMFANGGNMFGYGSLMYGPEERLLMMGIQPAFDPSPIGQLAPSVSVSPVQKLQQLQSLPVNNPSNPILPLAYSLRLKDKLFLGGDKYGANRFGSDLSFDLNPNIAGSKESLNARKESIMSEGKDNIATQAKSSSGFGASALRYAPVLGSGISALSDMMGWTGQPDYTAANIVGNSANNTPIAKAQHLGNYMSYNPLDRDFYLNKMNAQAGASRRGIINQSNGNRATATAGMLAQDNNYMNAIGDLGRKAEEYNYGQRQLVEDFNRGTNQFNISQDMQAQQINMQAAQAKTYARVQQAQMMAQEDNMSAQTKSANLSNFLNNMGGVGQEEFIMNQIKSNEGLYYNYGNRRDGTASYKAKDAANGGYLTIKNKKRKKK